MLGDRDPRAPDRDSFPASVTLTALGMGRRLIAGITVLSLALLLLVVAGVALVAFGGNARTGSVSAVLTIFTGTATIQRAGAAAVAAHSGDGLASGDSVLTGIESKAAVTYPDGSLTRLDSGTRITISVARTAGGALKTSFAQSAGLTWNQVKRLIGGSSFRVSGPNDAVAEVRGTRFGYYVEHDPSGRPVVWIDTYEGLVRVSGATGPAVSAGPGQRVTVKAGAAPTAPGAIPAADGQLSFTVFNQTVEAVGGTPVAFENGTLSSGQTTRSYTVIADGRSDLQFVLGWPGSTFQLAVVDPDGKVLAQPASGSPPLMVVAARARAGTWRFTVHDVQSGPQEAWWVVVGRK